MLSNILERFLGSEEQPDPKVPANISHSAGRIEALLTDYEAHNQLLSAIIMSPNQRKVATVQTRVTKVDSNSKKFSTTIFTPEENNKLLQESSSTRFTLNFHGVRHQFFASYDHTNTKSPVSCHWFHFPKGIEQIQLRNAFRVPINQDHPVRVSLTLSDRRVVTGNLFDLSASGMRLSTINSAKPEVGEFFQSCHFVLPDSNTIICQGQLIHWHLDEAKKNIYMGIQFKGVNGATQRALNRFLTESQRKHRQQDAL